MAGIQSLDLFVIEQHLDKISKFLLPCLPLANAHATDFITKKHWNTLIPRGVRDELLALSQEQLRNLPNGVSFPTRGTCTQDDDKYEMKDANKKEVQFPYTCVPDFIKDAKLCSVEGINIAISPQDLIRSIGGHGDEIFVGTFMNQKKSHEVEIMSKTCSSLAKYLNCRLVVDFGSGKGYLGNHLSLQYRVPVLGIDAANTNTLSAERRNMVLDKQWESLARNKILESQGRKLTKKEKKKLKENMKISGYNGNGDEKESKRDSDNTETAVEAEKAVETERQSKDVIKTELDKMDKTFKKKAERNLSRDKVTEAALNESDFVPCTTFIDKETNFIKLAQLHFPELFEKHYSESEPEESRSTACCQELCDCVDVAGRHNVRENLSMIHNPLNDLSLGTLDRETSQLPGAGDKFVIKTVDTEDTHIFKTVSAGDKHVSKIVITDDKHVLKTEITDTNNFKGESVSVKSSCDNQSQFKPIKEVCNDTSDQFNIMLTGLHTCGNLASTSMEVFVNSNELKVLCSVGCCYHLLDEKYLDRSPVDGIDTSLKGFPLSKLLIQSQFQLGNTARNLASQSLCRVSDFDKLQGERFYPRALLEVIIHDVCGPDGVVMKGMRKLEQKCASTQEYIRKACDKLGISDKVSDEMIESYLRKYADEQHRLAAFFQLKTILAPCIESLIILDRVCFLLEQKQVKDVFLVKMFDPVISPRCYGLVAIKGKKISEDI